MVASVQRVARLLPQVRGVHLALSLLMVAIVAFRFWPSCFALIFGGGVRKELFIHVHAVVYVGWLVLFVTQVALITTRRVALYRRLGPFGMAWGGAGVLVVGTVTTLCLPAQARTAQAIHARRDD